MELLQNFELQLKEEQEGQTSKCGEVFVNKFGKFLLDCFVCGIRFQPEEFFTHILKDHIDIVLASSLKSVPLSHDNMVNNLEQSSYNNKTNESQSCHANVPRSDADTKEIKEDPAPHFTNSEHSSTKEKRKIRHNKNNSTKNIEKYSKEKKVKLKSTVANKIKERVHQADETEHIYSCDICNLKLCKKRELLNHKRSKCGFRCSKCPKIIKEEKLFRIHSRNHNRKRKKPDPINEIYVCEICGRNFNDASNLRAHIKKHDPSRKLYPCGKCDKQFLKEMSLENHFKLKHLKEKPYECKVELCGRSFVNEKSLENHQAFHGERKYECSICNKKYLYKSKLKEHVKLYHVQGRIHHCPECDKSFYDPWTLNNHMVCHSDEKPFECDECDAKFPREKALLWHKKVHSGVKDYVCKLCNKAFYIYNGLYAHMKSHNIKYSKYMEKDLLFIAKKAVENNDQTNEKCENIIEESCEG